MKVSASLTDLVAFWGAITGTVSLCIAYFTYQRDNIRIELDVKKGWRVMHSPNHDPDKDYVVITVYNKGRRPVTITKAGWQFLKKNGGVILSDSMIFGVRELLEGKSTDYLMLQDEMEDFSEIEYFYASDGIGNLYKKYVTPLPIRYFYKTLFFLHIKKKSPLKDKDV